MVIIGYQGIGKSTVAKINPNYIDLESGCFWVDGKRAKDWYIPYCQMALHLSAQGKNVFVSSHECVRKHLMSVPTEEKIIAVVPDLKLKDRWINKLKKRYEESHLEKDYKAYMNAVDRYTENIKEIMNDVEDVRVLRYMNYYLEGSLQGN